MAAQQQTPRPPEHQPVMVKKVLEVLEPAGGKRALDLTVGLGGHARPIAERLGAEGLIVGIDADREALEVAKKRLSENFPCEARFFHGRFSEAGELMGKLGIEGFDLILADLGVGSHQLDSPNRGFSFDSEAPMDMRYDTSRGPTARDVVNRTPRERLADIFYELGEERYSRQIAAEICREREQEQITTPARLAEIVKRVYARRQSNRTWRIHPATRVMMALRIYVNRELQELEALLESLPEMLNPAARVAILTYHSLEAHRVKHTWKEQQEQGRIEEMPGSPFMPTEEEIRENPRARSAQLRAARRPGPGPEATL